MCQLQDMGENGKKLGAFHNFGKGELTTVASV